LLQKVVRRDRHFVQVRVFDEAQRVADLSYGSAYYSPVRAISPVTEVLFWNRQVGTIAPVDIDFGDGSPRGTIDRELKHTYKNRGNYNGTYHWSIKRAGYVKAGSQAGLSWNYF
jgi:hypothetical protein